MDTDSLLGLLTTIKEYWFLITLGLSVVATVFYMAVFRVNPWDTYREISYRREQVRFHNRIGQSLLERGHYKQAKEEYQNALNLDSANLEALNGRYLCDQFLRVLETQEWDAAIALAVQGELQNLGIIRRKEMLHIVNKFLGDLHMRISEANKAEDYYKQALTLKPDYLDALDKYGWIKYELLDYELMIQSFRKMTEVDPYDYRGFHGLGYSLYIRALKEEQNAEKRSDQVYQAALQSEKAKNLQISGVNIVADFGEIARTVKPELSIYYHQFGLKMVGDPAYNKLAINATGFYARLFFSDTSVYLVETQQQVAWLNYQMALNYLARARKAEDDDEAAKSAHDEWLARAQELDGKGTIYPIYEDQLQVLDLLLPKE